MGTRKAAGFDQGELARRLAEARRRAEEAARRKAEADTRARTETNDDFQPPTPGGPVPSSSVPPAPAGPEVEYASLAVSAEEASQWSAEEALAYTRELNAALAAHADDPDYQAELLDMAAHGLNASAELVGASAQEDMSEAEKDNLAQLVGELSTATEAMSEGEAAALASTIAEGIGDNSDLHALDDVFFRNHRDTGDLTLAKLVMVELEEAGNTDAMAELAVVHSDSADARAYNDAMASWKTAATDQAATAAAADIAHAGDSAAEMDAWGPVEAREFTSDLADEVEAHKDDPEYLARLMEESADGIARSAEIIGQATRENIGSEAEIEGLAGELSRLGNALPAEMAARVAIAVANEFDNSGEQKEVDDGFGAYIDRGGSPNFRHLVHTALVANGYDDAADELVGRHGTLEEVLDQAKDAGAATAEAAGYVVDIIENAGEPVLTFIKEKAVEPIVDLFIDALGIDDGVDSLENPGDTFTIGGYVEVNAEVHARVDASLECTMNEDGTYTVAADVEGELGAHLTAGLASGGPELEQGARVEFTFATAEEAKEAMEAMALAAAGSSLVAAAPGGPALVTGIAGGTMAMLQENISAIEFSAEVSAELDASLANVGGLTPDLSAYGEVSAGTTYRMEFRDEGPVLVRKATLEVEGEIQATLGLGLGNAYSQLIGRAGLPVGGELNVDGEVAVVTEIPLGDDVAPEDVLAAAVTGSIPPGMDQAVLAGAPEATTHLEGNLTLKADAAGDGVGVRIDFETEPMGAGDVASAFGDFLSAFASFDLDGMFAALPGVEVTGRTFQEEGIDIEPTLEIGGVGVSMEYSSVTRTYDEEGTILDTMED